jgi:hypothetical protein
VAGPAPAPASRNPIVIFIMSLFATAAMSHNRLPTERAAPLDAGE